MRSGSSMSLSTCCTRAIASSVSLDDIANISWEALPCSREILRSEVISRIESPTLATLSESCSIGEEVGRDLCLLLELTCETDCKSSSNAEDLRLPLEATEIDGEVDECRALVGIGLGEGEREIVG